MYRGLPPFKYMEPKTIGETVQILSAYGAKAKVLAGGVDLVDRMRRREINPEYIVSIQRIPGLDYIKGNGTGSLRIGMLTTLRSLELSPVVGKDYLLLWEAVHSVASIQVKNMGTAVGNLCVGTPASDVAAPLLALGAELKITSPDGERMVPIESFFVDVNQTILQPTELVTELLLPPLVNRTGNAFLRLTRSGRDIAKVNVAVVITVADNTCSAARIALGSVASRPIRAKRAEEILKGQRIEPKILTATASAAAKEASPITDIRSTAEYRKQMVKMLVRRATETALERAEARR